MLDHPREIKLVALFLLLASVRCAFGQTDQTVLAVGEWSKPITDRDHTLRGRLLIYDDRVPSAANHARVYLELQHIFNGGWPLALAVYYDIGSGNGALHLELRDRLGRTVPKDTNYADRGAANIYPNWIILPCDSTVRLRADTYTMGMQPKPKGLEFQVEDGCWLLPPHHQPVFLSGSFTPPKGHRSPLDYFVWQGTLELPKVKVSIR